MGIQSDVKDTTDTLLGTAWDERDGTVVPTTDTVKLKDGAVAVDATYLYADLADSSRAAQKLKKSVTAKIIRVYMNATVRILQHYGGEVRSFDGDRVMAIFMGGRKNNDAVRAAMGVNWAVHDVLRPKLKEKWPAIEDSWVMRHGIGIDTGDALIVRGGVRNRNDLVSIGAAPNVAAKLSGLRSNGSIFITKSVYSYLEEPVKLSTSGDEMWNYWGTQGIGGKEFSVYSSTWWKKP